MLNAFIFSPSICWKPMYIIERMVHDLTLSDPGSQHEQLCLWQRSWGRRLGISKGRIEPQESPLEILEHLPPKPESAYFLLCALTYTSDFMGGCPPLPLSEKRVSLQLQLIIPGCDSVSTYKLFWKSSSLPESVFLATCDCSEPPNCERQEMF